MVSYGNRVDVDEGDLIAFLAGDEGTSVIGSYIEGLTSGRKFIRAVARAYLEHAGYEVEVAEDGAAAVAAYQRAQAAGRRFDVVILDLTVPGRMGGKEALARRRRPDPDGRSPARRPPRPR